MFELNKTEKTTHPILDENNNKSSITMGKEETDVLQESGENVPDLIQETYDNIVKQHPNLSRRKKGDIVRSLLYKKVQKMPLFEKKVAKYF